MDLSGMVRNLRFRRGCSDGLCNHDIPIESKQLITTGCNYMNVIARVFNIVFVLVLAVPALAQENMRLTALHAVEGKPALYELSFTVTDTLKPDAAFEIKIPQNLDFSAVKVVGSPSMKGGFTFEVSDSALVLRRSGLGPTVPAGEKVKIIFGPLTAKKPFKDRAAVDVRINQAGRKSPVRRVAIFFQKDERVF